MCVSNAMRRVFWGPAKSGLIVMICCALFFVCAIGIGVYLLGRDNPIDIQAEATCGKLQMLDLKSKTPEQVKSLISELLTKNNAPHNKIIHLKSDVKSSYLVHLRKVSAFLAPGTDRYLFVSLNKSRSKVEECSLTTTNYKVREGD